MFALMPLVPACFSASHLELIKVRPVFFHNNKPTLITLRILQNKTKQLKVLKNP